MIKKLFILFLLFGVSLDGYSVDTPKCENCEAIRAQQNSHLYKEVPVYGPDGTTVGTRMVLKNETNTPGGTNTPANSPSNATTDTSSKDNILGITKDRLRTGNITYTDIPLMIVNAIEFLLAIAGSISVVALIYHAVRMQLASGITGDASGVDKAKKGMYGAMFGFVLSMSGWFLMTKFVALLSGSV